jgi:hypothetical protein
MVFEVKSASQGIAIVGEASATSAGQTAEVELWVRAPECKYPNLAQIKGKVLIANIELD